MADQTYQLYFTTGEGSWQGRSYDCLGGGPDTAWHMDIGRHVGYHDHTYPFSENRMPEHWVRCYAISMTEDVSGCKVWCYLPEGGWNVPGTGYIGVGPYDDTSQSISSPTGLPTGITWHEVTAITGVDNGIPIGDSNGMFQAGHFQHVWVRYDPCISASECPDFSQQWWILCVG